MGRRFKKRYFLILILLFIASLFLIKFEKIFNQAALWFLVSTICFLEMNRVMKPKELFEKNMVKSFFRMQMKLDQYQNLMRTLGIVGLIIAAVRFIQGIGMLIK